MAYRDMEVDPAVHVPDGTAVPASSDGRRRYEQALGRAAAAEARAGELDSAELAARSGPRRLVRGMARTDRRHLPPQRGAAGPPRPRRRSSGRGVRRGAGRARDGARRGVRPRLAGTRRTAGRCPRSQGAALAGEPPRGAERVRRTPAHADGQQPGREAAQGTGDRTAPVLRLRLRSRREARGAHVLGGRHSEPERHRRAALAERVAGGGLPGAQGKKRRVGDERPASADHAAEPRRPRRVPVRRRGCGRRRMAVDR